LRFTMAVQAVIVRSRLLIFLSYSGRVKNMQMKIVSVAALLFLAACKCGTDEQCGTDTQGFAEAQVGAPATQEVTVEWGPNGGVEGQYASIPSNNQVYYALDKYEVTAQYRPVVEEMAKWLMANNAAKVTIAGHCDERGTREYNLGLGARRANSVKKALVASGIQEDRIETISYGKDRPLVEGSNEAAWALNRTSIIKVS